MTRRQLMAFLAGTPLSKAFSARERIEARVSDVYPSGIGLTLAKPKRFTISGAGHSVTIKTTKLDYESTCDRIEIGGERSVAGLRRQSISVAGYPLDMTADLDALQSLINADEPVMVSDVKGSYRLLRCAFRDDIYETGYSVEVELARVG
jgi:hypothetical protein